MATSASPLEPGPERTADGPVDPELTSPDATDTAPAPVGLVGRLRGSSFLRHVLTLMTGTAVAQIIPLVTRPVLTRIYTEAEFGTYSLYLSIAGAFATIGALRYDVAVVMPEKDSDARGLVKLASRSSIVVALLVTIGLTLWAKPVANLLRHPDLAPYLPAVGLLVLALTQLSSRQYWLNRRKRYKEMARNRMGQSASTSAVHLGAGFAGAPGAWGLVIGSLAGQLFSMTNLWRLTRHETAPQPGDSAVAMAKEYKKMPLVNGPNAVVDTIRLNGINLMIGAFFSKGALGQFSQAWQLLTMPMALINTALSQVFYQRLATTKRGLMFGEVKRASVRALLIGIVPFALIWLVSPWLFPFVLGNKGDHDWTLAGRIARVLTPWLYMNFVTSPISLVFLTVKRQGTMFCFAVAYCAVPLSLIWFHHESILQTMTWVSWAMAALLVVFLLLALWVSWEYDRGKGLREGEDDGSELDAEERVGIAEELVEDEA